MGVFFASTFLTVSDNVVSMKKYISYLFVITSTLILFSCSGSGITEKGGPIYLSAGGNECQLYCIGERYFPNEIYPWGWKGLHDNLKRKNAEGNVRGYSFWSGHSAIVHYKACEIARYSWNAFDQVEVDIGEQICSAQSRTWVDSVNKWICNDFDSNIDEKTQIKSVLQDCEYLRSSSIEKKKTYKSTKVNKTKKEKEIEIMDERVEQAVTTCKKLGFSEEDDSLSNCALEIYKTENSLQQSNISINSNDALLKQMQLNNSIRLMQEGLKMMSPPQPKLKCRTTLSGWTCY